MRRLSVLLLLFFLYVASHAQGPRLNIPIGHSERIVGVSFSPDSKLALTVSTDGTAKMWEARSGKLVKDFKSGGDASITLIINAWFTPGGKRVLLEYDNKNIRSYEISTGILSPQIIPMGKDSVYIDEGQINADQTRLCILATDNSAIHIADIETLKPLFRLGSAGNTISDFVLSFNGDMLMARSSDNRLRVWNIKSGKLLFTSRKYESTPYDYVFTGGDKNIYLQIGDGKSEVVALATGKTVGTAALSEDAASLVMSGGKFCIKLFGEKDFFDGQLPIRYWDSISVTNWQTGERLYGMNNIFIPQTSDFTSASGDRFLVITKDSSVAMIEAATGKRLFTIPRGQEPINMIQFRGDGKFFLTCSWNHPIRIWNAANGQPASQLNQQPSNVYDAKFSADGKTIIAGYEDKKGRIWDLSSGKILTELTGKAVTLHSATFDSTGRRLIIQTAHSKLLMDLESGGLSVIDTLEDKINENFHTNLDAEGVVVSDTLIFTWIADYIGIQNMNTNTSYTFWSPEKEINRFVALSADNKKVVATSINNTIKIYDIEQNSPLLRIAIIDSVDYIVVDSLSRYDGTVAARKLLYFACGDELIGLDQVKDQLWIPHLAERVMRGEPMNAVGIDDLKICGLTPIVETGTASAEEYLFRIQPRSGGLGETVVSFNNTPTLSIQPSQLIKKGAAYELHLKKEDLKSYVVAGQENSISVRSYTSNNNTASRSTTISFGDKKESLAPPNLYAVMVGVSDYKGTSLDLEYAAIDASDISRTITASAKKLLGDGHVFVYNLTTEKDHYLLPEKKAIKQVFEEIGKKAASNDILFLFLSGHGVVGQKDKQYYYLTAEASSAAEESSFATTAISTAELTDWINPQKIKAQKRILILDACYSGQMINGVVKIGNDKQGFLAARGDDRSQQERAIDKLNEKSGLFILSASSSDQKAFESGVYSHGYLTYSLLKAIKLQPDILREGKFLDVGRWLDAAGESVSEMAKSDGSKQQPQIISSTNFDIGMVDQDVTSSIDLSETKARFASGSFFNTQENEDNLELRRLTDAELQKTSLPEGGNRIIFTALANGNDVYSLSGGYTVTGETVKVSIKIKKGRETVFQFEEQGSKNLLPALVSAIIKKSVDWVDDNK